MIYFTSVSVEANLSGSTWTDLIDDIDLDQGIRVSYGIQGNGPLDRVASSGRMTFVLRNDAQCSGGVKGYYSPGNGNCRTGFGAGLKVRLVLEYDGRTFYKFYGRVLPQGIQGSQGAPGNETVTVTVGDYMELCAIHRLLLPTLTTNKRIDEVVPLIIANMPIAPLSTDYEIGASTFETVFDTVRSYTTALAEMSKLALSELGYIYVKRGQDYGEILHVDGRLSRSPAAPLNVPLAATLSEYLLAETSDILLTEDDENLLIDDVFEAGINVISGDLPLIPATELITSYGKHLANLIRYTAYPTYVDAAATTVLFSLNSVIEIAAGETKSNILGRYRDPVGGAARVSGMNMVTPVATTDYTMNASAGGGGADMTANLTVTASYGAEGVRYTLTNTHGSTTGYITKLQARGKGIYAYDPVTVIAEDTASQAIYGTQELTLDFKYQRDPTVAEDFATLKLNQLKSPSTVIDRISYLPHMSAYAMMQFLYAEPGDCVQIYDEVNGVDGVFFINSVEFAIGAGYAAVCSYIPINSAFDTYALWELETVGKSELGSTTYLS